MSKEHVLCDGCGEIFCSECDPLALTECAAGNVLHCDECLLECDVCQTAAEPVWQVDYHRDGVDYPPLEVIDGGEISPDHRHSW